MLWGVKMKAKYSKPNDKVTCGVCGKTDYYIIVERSGDKSDFKICSNCGEKIGTAYTKEQICKLAKEEEIFSVFDSILQRINHHRKVLNQEEAIITDKEKGEAIWMMLSDYDNVNYEGVKK